jgi:predicted RNA binding protein YcfA (HicA-like mRNA interferase family)
MNLCISLIHVRLCLLGKLSNISGKEAVKAFQKAGWQTRGQVGSHLVLTKQGVRANLTVPQHAELAPGTLRALIRVAELTVDEFLDLL